jgi:dTDP-4-amino-4,6-dideoxygalactose transaminase
VRGSGFPRIDRSLQTDARAKPARPDGRRRKRRLRRLEPIPFNRPRLAGNEQQYIVEAIANGHLSADGPFSELCSRWLEQEAGTAKALLTHSCTAALEMIALLLDVEPGDEVVMPSFTFVSTANAFVLRGGVPVFVDIRPDTLNIDETKIEEAITPRTRAVVAVHYAGVPCEMDAIRDIAARHGLFVVEDAAQALMSTYRGRPAGGLADLAAVSFHETKHVMSGEGGALLLNDERWVERALVLRDKGTNRNRFFRGEVDKYSWIDVGSSYGMSELNAAFLYAQLERAGELVAKRLRTWDLYHDALEALEERGLLRRPAIPAEVGHNAHLYYVLLPDETDRDSVLTGLKELGVHAVFHYVPLHSSEAGRRHGRASAPLPYTDAASDRVIRLPLWNGMSEGQISHVVEAVSTTLGSRVGA